MVKKIKSEFPRARVAQINKAIQFFVFCRDTMGYSKDKARKWALKSAGIIK